ncbi:MAG: hypothetical protein GF331_25965, partial [Chitinivibrionales bacterium]|nr:hypothetical protein [Chitinivibrionales bacterium]
MNALPKQLHRPATTALASAAALTMLCIALFGCNDATNPFYVPAEISYPDSLITYVGVPADTTAPTLAKNVEVDSYTIAPELPNGLAMDAATGSISGVPEGPAGVATYSINAHNQWGVSDDALILIMVCPLSPRSVQAANTGNQSVQLSWSAVDDDVSYAVYRADVRDGEYQRIGGTVDSTYEDTTQLQAGEQYFYYVVAEHAETHSSLAVDTLAIEIAQGATAPVVRITSPSADTLVANSALTVEYTVNGTAFSKLVTLNDGENEVIIDTTIPAGLTGGDTVYVTLDANAPSAPLVQGVSPTSDQTPTWSWSSDGSGCGMFRYALDSDDLAGASSETEETTYTPSTDLTEGTHTLYVWERDLAGNWSASGSKAIVIDVTAPGAPQVNGATPTNDQTPTWTWSSDADGSGTFRYSLDADELASASAETADTSFVPSADLTEGAHTLYVWERDPAGNWSASGSKSIEIDITAPAAPTVNGATPTNDRTPTWSWSSDAQGCGIFRYSLNSSTLAAASPETTATSYTPDAGLTEDTHTLYVWERDVAGNWSAAGSKVIVIDASAPGVPQVNGVSPTNNSRPTWTWSSAGGIGTYRLQLDNPNLAGVTETTTDTAFTPSADLAEGAHTLYVQERDAAGNWSASGVLVITVDVTPPEPPTVTGPAQTQTLRPTWSWTSGGDGNGMYRHRLDNPDLTSGATATTGTSYTPGSDLSEGTHTLYVQERDAAGNWSSSGQFAVTIDVAAPGAPDVTGPARTSTQRPTWSWTSGGDGTGDYRYRLDNPDLTTGATATTETSFTPAADLAEGQHTLYVQERDAADNWSATGQFTVTIDITPPSPPSVNGAAQTTELRPTWTWASGGGGNGTYRYRLDNADLATGATVTTETSFTPGHDLSQGSHTLYVQERDEAGNWSSSGQFLATIDRNPPEAPVVSGPAQTGELRPTWTWSSGGGGNGTYRYRLDNANLTTGATVTSNTSYTPAGDLSEGQHTLYVQERDVAGNWSASGSHTVTIDVSVPIVGVLAPALTTDSAIAEGASLSVSGSVQSNLNISTVTATLNGSPVAVSLSNKQWFLSITSLAGTQWNEVVVTAKDELQREGQYTFWVYGRFGLEAPSAPATESFCSSIELTWPTDARYDGYLVWRKRPTDSEFALLSGGIDGTMYLDAALANGDNAQYRLQGLYARQAGSFMLRDTSALSAAVPGTAMICFEGTFSGQALNDVRPLADGGVIAAGGNRDPSLLRLAPDGSQLWSRNYYVGNDAAGTAVGCMQSGGFLLAGEAIVSSQNRKVLLICTDASGDTVWTKRLGVPERSESARGLAILHDGGYALACETAMLGRIEGDMWLVRGLANGDTSWTRTVGGHETGEVGRALAQLDDGSFLLAGGGTGMTYSKVSLSGTVQWTKTLEDLAGWSPSLCESAVELSTGDLALVGCKNAEGGTSTDGWIVKCSAS